MGYIMCITYDEVTSTQHCMKYETRNTIIFLIYRIYIPPYIILYRITGLLQSGNTVEICQESA